MIMIEYSQADEVIRLVNIRRAEEGVAPLTKSRVLHPAAQKRAREASLLFSHTRPDGSPWKTVFDEFGIVSVYRGENLAEGQKTARAVVNAWMASGGHRKNILNPAYDRIAVGMHKRSGVQYWSQLFAQANLAFRLERLR